MTDPSVRLRRVDAAALEPGVLIRVRRTLLPLYWLRGVPVLRQISHELNVFERFLLEMALELGSVSGQDVTEVLDLQPEFLVRGAWRLAVAGALRLDGDAYRVVPDVAEELLRSRKLPQQVQSTADFVLLPRTGDLLAVASGGGGWLAEADRQRRKLRPQCTAPAPESLWPCQRATYLAGRVGAGDIAGSDRGIVGVVIPSDRDEALLPRLRQPRGGKKQSEADDTDNLPRGCPAYNCSAQVREGPSGQVVVEAFLTGAGPLDSDSDDQATERGRRPGEDPFTLRAELTGANNLVATWQAQLDALDSEPNIRAGWHMVAGTQHDYAHAQRTGVSTWVFHVGGDAAEAIAASGRSLAEPAGLEIESEETTVEAHVEFCPADEAAHALFARDLLVASLLTAPDPAAALAGAAGDEAAVRERIWQLGHFRLAYDLREPEDFGYE